MGSIGTSPELASTEGSRDVAETEGSLLIFARFEDLGLFEGPASPPA